MKKTTAYYSTNLKAPHVSFSEALLRGLAPDGGLYLPDHLEPLSTSDLESLRGLSYPLLASEVLFNILGDVISKEAIIEICNDIYTFPITVENVIGKNYIMRLDSGPTASFKDFAALMMGRLMEHFLEINNKKLTILTATSGDTGSAVANAFYGLHNISVIILFPYGEVTDIQRKQMTTLRGNISVISVDGKFDDCQHLVKSAFMDPALSTFNLSSANSINIGRLIPQSVYYFYAWAKLSEKSSDNVVFSVPCGNFGNLAGGLIARNMGLPVRRFVIATNENDEVPSYIRTSEYNRISPSKNCISSAMNVGHPSNLARIFALYGGQMDENGNILKQPDMIRLRNDFFTMSISDDETRETIESAWRKFGIILEPHGAVAWAGLLHYLESAFPEKDDGKFFISLETAHPAKFGNEIMKILEIEPALPESLKKAKNGIEEYISLENDYEMLKQFIIKNY